VCFEGVRRPIGFAEGSGHASSGGLFTAEEALQPSWREHFSLARGVWLLPYVMQLAAGDVPSQDEVLALATTSLGTVPASYEVPLDLAQREVGAQ
jgi:hypothetical protein